MKVTQTHRGFSQGEPILTTYGHEVRVYESSAASAPHIWLHTTDGDECNVAAHMTLEQAQELRDQLDYFIAHHYQVDP